MLGKEKICLSIVKILKLSVRQWHLGICFWQSGIKFCMAEKINLRDFCQNTKVIWVSKADKFVNSKLFKNRLCFAILYIHICTHIHSHPTGKCLCTCMHIPTFLIRLYWFYLFNEVDLGHAIPTGLTSSANVVYFVPLIFLEF